jgi:GNAT superfamily N-acetyltransferase
VTDFVIRRAEPADQPAVEAVVHGAYSVYIGRIGKPPGPMLDDYGRLIASGAVHVVDDADGIIAALIVLLPKTDHLLLDNIAVRPDRQGRGLGRRLMEFAEAEALRWGFDELRLYTHVTMTENIALYTRIGFVETGRCDDAGYDRVFMSKQLDSIGPYLPNNPVPPSAR